MRLQKYMAQCGVASRRESEKMILDARVKVNDLIVKKLGTKINIDEDVVKVDNKIIKIEKNMLYIMLHKPEGYVTSAKSKHNQKIVMDLITGVKERIFPVGRLDYDTSGLLLLTNDGNLAYKLTHPKYEVPKKYIALVAGIPNDKKLIRFKKGLKIDGKLTAKAHIEILKRYRNSSVLEIIIHEGRNRQVRKMCKYINNPVIKLKRISIGNLNLDDLEIGKWRYLTEKELKYLKLDI